MDILESFISRLNREKEKIIRKAFEEKKYLHLLDNFEKTRFPRVVKEIRDNRENWYVDNGTNEGLLIISIRLETNLNEDGSFSYYFMIN